MFYELTVKDFIRVAPTSFNKNTKESILQALKESYDNYINKDLGFVAAVIAVDKVGDGVIIPGDGAAYYETVFRLLVYKPEIQELVLGRVSDITNFGAFLDIGSADGMIHIGQTMDDYVSFSKSKVLAGKESKKTLRVNDKCLARIIAVSYKEPSNPKIGLTMRQNKLGNLKWDEEEVKKKTKK